MWTALFGARSGETERGTKRPRLNNHVLLSARILRKKTQKGTRRLVYEHGETYGAMYPQNRRNDAIREVICANDDQMKLLVFDLVFSDVHYAHLFMISLNKHVEKYGDHLTYVDGHGATINDIGAAFSKAEYQYPGFLDPVLEREYKSDENPDSPPDDALSDSSRFHYSEASTLTDNHLRVENRIVEEYFRGRLQSAHIVPAAVCDEVDAFRYLNSDSSARKFNRLALTFTVHELFDGTNKMKKFGMTKENMPKISFESTGEPREVADNGQPFYQIALRLWCHDEDTAKFMERRIDNCNLYAEKQQCGEIGRYWLITNLHVECPKFGVPKTKIFKIKDENKEFECKLPSPSGDFHPIDFESDSIPSVDVLLACLKWRHANVCKLWSQHSDTS